MRPGHGRWPEDTHSYRTKEDLPMGQASSRAPATADLSLFDAWCVVGRQHSRAFRGGLEAGELVELMDQYGIREALVSHAAARLMRVPFSMANEILMEEIAGQPRLHPCWSLSPELEWYDRTPEQVVGAMLAAGARAAHLPAMRQPFELWSWRPLLQELEAHRVPCLVDYGNGLVLSVPMRNVIDWQKIHDIACAFPELPLILTGFRFPRREMFLLMTHCPNVYSVDFSFAWPGERAKGPLL
ncbi:MAG: hypothetical protein ACUVWR_18900, partial [Anaerolineae bacterium]